MTEIMAVDSARQIFCVSDDGGNTIHACPFDSVEMKKEDYEVIKQQELAIRSRRMMRIIRLAETNSTLRDALEKLETLYILVKDDENN